jgi:hypothetical protein
MREILGGAKAIVPSTKKVGGTRLESRTSTLLRAQPLRRDGDRRGGRPESRRGALALVMTTGPRIHARVGGLKASEVKGEDGLR